MSRDRRLVTPRLHLPAHDEPNTSGLGLPLCGGDRRRPISATEPTCKTCLKRRGVRHEYTRQVSWEEVLLDLDSLLRWPKVERYPLITPESYRAMRCRTADAMTPATFELEAREGGQPNRYRICRCEFCEADERNALEARKAHESQQIRPHQKHAYPFGSYRAALSFLAAWQRDGASVRSHAGSMQARCSETALLGATIQTTLRTDRDSLEVRRAGLAVDVRRCLERAFADEQGRHGHSLASCMLLMLDSVSDAPVTAEDLGAERVAVQRHGRRHVQIELAVAELTPWPRAPRLVAEIERRRREKRVA